MDSGLHYDHRGSFTLEEELLAVGPAPGAWENGANWGAGWPVHSWAPCHTGLKLTFCGWSMARRSCSLTSRAQLRGKEAACWREHMCLLPLCSGEDTRTAQIPKLASFVLLLFEESPVAEWQLLPGGVEGEGKIKLRDNGKQKIKSESVNYCTYIQWSSQQLNERMGKFFMCW